MAMHTIDDLRMRQALPLSMKIAFTKTRIREWVNYYGMDGVYIAFSGGKDSTVLVDLVDETFPDNDIPLVFCDTGLEYPEIREFVKSYGDRVVWLKPEMQFKKVIEQHGYPFISKNVSHNVKIARNKPNGDVANKVFSPEKRGRYALYRYRYLLNAPFDISDKCCYVMKKSLHTIMRSKQEEK